MKNLTTRVPNYTHIYFSYSNFCLSRQGASLYLDHFYFQNANVHADAFSSPKQTILHRYRNEINCTVNQLQLNYSTNVNLLIPRFMKSLCVISIKLNTLTDVPYQMTVGGALFTYFKTCERGRVKDYLFFRKRKWSHVYNAVRYNTGFFPWTLTTAL